MMLLTEDDFIAALHRHEVKYDCGDEHLLYFVNDVLLIYKDLITDKTEISRFNPYELYRIYKGYPTQFTFGDGSVSRRYI